MIMVAILDLQVKRKRNLIILRCFFKMVTYVDGQKDFYFKLFKQLYVTIQLSVNTVLMSKNSSISNNSVKHEHAV